jgi:hypothetical protein
MVDRDVVGQTRSCQARANRFPGASERGCQEVPGQLKAVERPPAVKHADPEPTGEKRPGPSTPFAVFRKRPSEARNVIAAVVVEDEEAAAWAKQAFRARELNGIDASKR